MRLVRGRTGELVQARGARPVRRDQPRHLAKAGDREREVAQLVARERLTMKQAAERLGLSQSTVADMIRRVREAEQEERNRRHLG